MGGFNPTMVRLRRRPGRPGRRHQPVSIPLWCDCDRAILLGQEPPDPGFNPTMVRLRPPSKNQRQPICLTFQSHYGAIATGTRLGARHKVGGFQSHYGAIATQICRKAFLPDSLVSIPLWCDCDILQFTQLRKLMSCFNPTMVRLRQPSL